MPKTTDKAYADAERAYDKAWRAFYKAMAGNSLRAAVNSFCIECMGYSLKEVRECTSVCCPLNPHRPLSKISCRAHGAPERRAKSPNPKNVLFAMA